MKQRLRESQEEKDKSTVIVRDFNISLCIISRKCRQKIIKNREDLNTINQLNLKVRNQTTTTITEQTFF